MKGQIGPVLFLEVPPPLSPPVPTSCAPNVRVEAAGVSRPCQGKHVAQAPCSFSVNRSRWSEEGV